MARIARSIGVHKTAHLALTFWVMGLRVLAVGSLAAPVLGLACLFLLAVYSTAVGATAMAGCVRTGRLSVLFWIPLLLVSLHLVRGLGYLFPWPSAAK